LQPDKTTMISRPEHYKEQSQKITTTSTEMKNNGIKIYDPMKSQKKRLHCQYAITELNTNETARDRQNHHLILYIYNLQKIKQQGVFNAIL